jgi:hypothetical protein
MEKKRLLFGRLCVCVCVCVCVRLRLRVCVEKLDKKLSTLKSNVKLFLYSYVHIT